MHCAIKSEFDVSRPSYNALALRLSFTIIISVILSMVTDDVESVAERKKADGNNKKSNLILLEQEDGESTALGSSSGRDTYFIFYTLFSHFPLW